MAIEYTTERPEILRALQRLNWNYGYGDVKAIRRFLDGRIEVDITAPYCQPRTFIARTVGRTSVRFRGHQIDYQKDQA